MNMRLLSLLPSDNPVSKTKHYRGFPPDLTGGVDTRQELGKALFLVIQEESDGVFLYRHGVQGVCVGDTWHMSIDEAKEQASYEYGEPGQEWINVPEEVTDVIAFALDRANST